MPDVSTKSTAAATASSIGDTSHRVRDGPSAARSSGSTSRRTCSARRRDRRSIVSRYSRTNVSKCSQRLVETGDVPESQRLAGCPAGGWSASAPAARSDERLRSMLTVSPWVTSVPTPTGGTASSSGCRRTNSDTIPSDRRSSIPAAEGVACEVGLVGAPDERAGVAVRGGGVGRAARDRADDERQEQAAGAVLDEERACDAALVPGRQGHVAGQVVEVVRHATEDGRPRRVRPAR